MTIQNVKEKKNTLIKETQNNDITKDDLLIQDYKKENKGKTTLKLFASKDNIATKKTCFSILDSSTGIDKIENVENIYLTNFLIKKAKSQEILYKNEILRFFIEINTDEIAKVLGPAVSDKDIITWGENLLNDKLIILAKNYKCKAFLFHNEDIKNKKRIIFKIEQHNKEVFIESVKQLKLLYAHFMFFSNEVLDCSILNGQSSNELYFFRIFPELYEEKKNDELKIKTPLPFIKYVSLDKIGKNKPKTINIKLNKEEFSSKFKGLVSLFNKIDISNRILNETSNFFNKQKEIQLTKIDIVSTDKKNFKILICGTASLCKQKLHNNSIIEVFINKSKINYLCSERNCQYDIWQETLKEETFFNFFNLLNSEISRENTEAQEEETTLNSDKKKYNESDFSYLNNNTKIENNLINLAEEENSCLGNTISKIYWKNFLIIYNHHEMLWDVLPKEIIEKSSEIDVDDQNCNNYLKLNENFNTLFDKHCDKGIIMKKEKFDLIAFGKYKFDVKNSTYSKYNINDFVFNKNDTDNFLDEVEEGKTVHFKRGMLLFSQKNEHECLNLNHENLDLEKNSLIESDQLQCSKENSDDSTKVSFLLEKNTIKIKKLKNSTNTNTKNISNELTTRIDNDNNLYDYENKLDEFILNIKKFKPLKEYFNNQKLSLCIKILSSLFSHTIKITKIAIFLFSLQNTLLKDFDWIITTLKPFCIKTSFSDFKNVFLNEKNYLSSFHFKNFVNARIVFIIFEKNEIITEKELDYLIKEYKTNFSIKIDENTRIYFRFNLVLLFKNDVLFENTNLLQIMIRECQFIPLPSTLKKEYPTINMDDEVSNLVSNPDFPNIFLHYFLIVPKIKWNSFKFSLFDEVEIPLLKIFNNVTVEKWLENNIKKSETKTYLTLAEIIKKMLGFEILNITKNSPLKIFLNEAIKNYVIKNFSIERKSCKLKSSSIKNVKKINEYGWEGLTFK